MMLITAAELAIHLGATFSAADTTRAEQIISMKSGDLQEYCNLVGLVSVADDEIVLKGSYSPKLQLPLGPVTSVSEVSVDGTVVSDYWLVKDVLHRGNDNLDPPIFGEFYNWGGPNVEVAVTYTHGLSSVPDKVKSVCFDLCAQAFSNPTRARSLSIDNYSASWGAIQSGMSDDDRRSLRAWHRASYSADVA